MEQQKKTGSAEAENAEKESVEKEGAGAESAKKEKTATERSETNQPETDAPRRPKRCAVINDLSGIGRCSLTVSMPILSVMGVQCCPLPTAFLSTHTAFPLFTIKDLTDQMEPVMEVWQKLAFSFDGISVGFLSSEKQVEIVLDVIRRFRTRDTAVIIDPVMGDDGKPYVTCTKELQKKIRRLVPCADILTPNLTEACLLTENPWHAGRWSRKELDTLMQALLDEGAGKVVITGIPFPGAIGNLCGERGESSVMLRNKISGHSRPGTGDVFSSIVTADAVLGNDFTLSVRKASRFIRRCIRRTEEEQIPQNEGVCFEEFLKSLK